MEPDDIQREINRRQGRPASDEDMQKGIWEIALQLSQLVELIAERFKK